MRRTGTSGPLLRRAQGGRCEQLEERRGAFRELRKGTSAVLVPAGDPGGAKHEPLDRNGRWKGRTWLTPPPNDADA